MRGHEVGGLYGSKCDDILVRAAFAHDAKAFDKNKMGALILGITFLIHPLRTQCEVVSCQLTHCKPATRENSRTLRVTSVA
jgi:hypothetical protein